MEKLRVIEKTTRHDRGRGRGSGRGRGREREREGEGEGEGEDFTRNALLFTVWISHNVKYRQQNIEK